MGQDAVILFRVEGKETPDFAYRMPPNFEAVWLYQDEISEEVPEATHKIETGARYYSETYPRGPWPSICAVLLVLLACPEVKKVWYGSDHSTPTPCDPERVLALSKHFMKERAR